jgi:hypothetical protein
MLYVKDFWQHEGRFCKALNDSSTLHQLFNNYNLLYVTDFGSTKGDLIAELKLSHNVGGVSKLKYEQVN